jgi:hypothetical protein
VKWEQRKTVIGEMALHWAWSLQNQKGIYTTPLKALSNEKYRDFCSLYGRTSVGLATGDVSINKGAKISIMTTEVYRNIAWRASIPNEANDELTDTTMVILDELHYMGNPGRGGVWEESIVTSPSHMQIIGLSATLANGQDICAWMEHVTQRPTVLVQVPDHKRPVPLRFCFATRDGLYPLFRDPDAGPGAPHGLLGLRGNGKDTGSSTTKLSKKTKGFGETIPAGDIYDASSSSLLPEGLQVNPVLIRASEKRMQKVDRALEKQMQLRRSTNVNRDEEIKYDSPRRGRKRSISSPARTMMSQREARQERERLLKKEMRRSVPSLHALIERLRRKDLLPAICFIFSRSGCDMAAQSVASSMMSSTGFDLLLSPPNDDVENYIDDADAPTTKPKRKRRQRNIKRKTKDILEDKDGRSFRENGNFVSEDLLFETMMNDDMIQDDLTSLINNDMSVLSSDKHIFYSSAGLLELHEVKKVATAIIAFNERNQELAFDEDIVEQFLLGLGSHVRFVHFVCGSALTQFLISKQHAGMLPAHKSFVEVLYQRQLMKVVFATETLAAGINMPARTTVICAMAKRGNGSSMNLLETSNLLQMAGRAGRRGKDKEGTCVIVATPFESHDDAARILTDAIKPISSQFSPSYSLCINLIARGGGKLNVAKQLVSQSFAMWENKRKAFAADNREMGTTLSKKTAFLDLVADFLRKEHDKNPVLLSASKVLEDRYRTLTLASKSLLGLTNTLSLEKATLSYLEIEYNGAIMGNQIEQDHPERELLVAWEDKSQDDINHQVALQQKRVHNAIEKVNAHPLSMAAAAVNAAISEGGKIGARLLATLEEAREGTGPFGDVALDGVEFTTFAKAARDDKNRLEKRRNEPVDSVAPSVSKKIDSWDEFVSITNTLVDYGCLLHRNGSNKNLDDMEKEYGVTVAGEQVGLLGLENSLWNLVALGGVWEVATAHDGDDDDIENYVPSEQMARGIVENLLALSPSQLAGFVSCLVPMNSRGSGATMIQQFQMLEPAQQEAIRKAFTVSDRMLERQSVNGVSESVVCSM